MFQYLDSMSAVVLEYDLIVEGVLLTFSIAFEISFGNGYAEILLLILIPRRTFRGTVRIKIIPLLYTSLLKR